MTWWKGMFYFIQYANVTEIASHANKVSSQQGYLNEPLF